MIVANSLLLQAKLHRLRQGRRSISRRLVHAADLHPLAEEARIDLLVDHVDAGDRDQLGLEAVAEDARARIAVDAGVRPAAQMAVDVDVAVGEHFATGTDRGERDQVAAFGIDLLPGAHRLVDHDGGVAAQGSLGGLRRRLGRGQLRGPARGQQRQPGIDRHLAPGVIAVLQPDRNQLLLAQPPCELREIERRQARDRPRVQHHGRVPEEIRRARQGLLQNQEKPLVPGLDQPQRDQRLQMPADLEQLRAVVPREPARRPSIRPLAP